MTLPREFENELEAWLTRALDERLERERRILLTLVVDELKRFVDELKRFLAEEIQRDVKQSAQALEQQFADLQGLFERFRDLTEKMARLDLAAHDEINRSAAKN